MKDYKLAIDMCYFYGTHEGGKDEVAYNLLRGFDEIGVSDQVICFAYKNLKEIISRINPNITICIVPKIRTSKYFANLHMWFRGYYIEKWCIKHNVGMLLFPNKPTPNRKFKMPTMMIPHDIEVFESGDIKGVSYLSKIEKRVKKEITNDFKNRDYIVAISDFDKNEMYKFFPWAKNKIIRIYNPIRFEKIKTDRTKNRKYITVINIQWIHKNIITIIKAFAKIAGSVEYDLLLVGRYPSNIEELKKYVMDSGISERVIFTGFVKDDELSKIIDETRIYINASFFEGFGMTNIEMMGNKIPTISSDTTAIPEVTMGLCRYYSPVEDSDALAMAILDEINEPTTEKELESISLAVRERYSYERIANEYWDFVCKQL